MAKLIDLLRFMDERTNRRNISDFPGAENGLQIENNGTVSRIGAAVDASESAFQLAIDAGVDLLIVHHGMFWRGLRPITGSFYRKLKLAMDNNLAVYSSHLPLDAHTEIGNNARIAEALEFPQLSGFVTHEGIDIGLIAQAGLSRDQLRRRLEGLFPQGITAIECGRTELERVGILSGSGRSALPFLKGQNCDTLITGELRQEHFTLAEEEGLNLYICGHYATETFGVSALAEEAARKFSLDWDFLPTGCPL